MVRGVVKPRLYPQGLLQACARTLRWSRMSNATCWLVVFGADIVLCGELVETKLDGGGLDEPEDGDGECKELPSVHSGRQWCGDTVEEC